MGTKPHSLISLRRGNMVIPVAELNRKHMMLSCRLSQDPHHVICLSPISYASMHCHLSKRAWSDTQNKEERTMLFLHVLIRRKSVCVCVCVRPSVFSLWLMALIAASEAAETQSYIHKQGYPSTTVCTCFYYTYFLCCSYNIFSKPR